MCRAQRQRQLGFKCSHPCDASPWGESLETPQAISGAVAILNTVIDLAPSGIAGMAGQLLTPALKSMIQLGVSLTHNGLIFSMLLLCRVNVSAANAASTSRIFEGSGTAEVP